MARGKAVTYATRARRYAQAVVQGKVVSCLPVRQACQRFLDDFKAARRRGFPFRFDASRGERVCRFVELLPHVKGQWAIRKMGDPASGKIRLEDWQVFFIMNLFGWVEKGTGHRRFRTAVLLVPRKNGKSVLAAALGLYCFAADGEHGAEVYSGATTQKQAWEVFRPARLMAKETRPFIEHFGVDVRAESLVRIADQSRFEPVIGKPGDGASPLMAIIDEYHEHPDAVQYETMETGMGARAQPLMLVITTAGDNLAGPCYAQYEECKRMLSGQQPNDRLFALLYEMDPEDDWTSEEALRKANPNYGVSVGAEYLEIRRQEAVANARKQGAFKTKHLNLWVTARSPWMNMQWWERQKDTSLRPEQFTDCRCWGALDLASKVDLAPVVRVFARKPEGETEYHYYAFVRTYCPQATIDEPDRREYQGWAHDGWLIGTEGEVIDYTRIREDLLQDHRDHGFDEVAFDPWGATQMLTELDAEGVPVLTIDQNVKQLSDPMKWVEALVKAGRLHHQGDPCFTWQISNVVAKEDANENIYPRKDFPDRKIDAAVALIMCMARAMAGNETDSVYEERGFLEF